MYRAVILSSGGVDSTTLLWHYAKLFGPRAVLALTVSYAQRHQRELYCIDQLVQRLGCTHRHLDLSEVFRGSKSALAGDACTQAALPTDSYETQASKAKVIATNVELRNLVFASAAASIAMQIGASIVAVGVHASDFAYPDCGPQFLESLQSAISLGSAERVSLEAPWLTIKKEEVIAYGKDLGVPYELTWSCYSTGNSPCGRCASCLDRRRAFLAAGFEEDPALGTGTPRQNL